MSGFKSVCLYCGSSNEVSSEYLDLATAFGETVAGCGLRLVYGGGGVGLMGAAARAAHEQGGDVLGVMPKFLLEKERIFEDVPHRIVDTMHERKQIMFDESDAFVVLPGGIGTLEEAIEMLSWARLGLHAKPMAFLDEDDFWSPLFVLMDHIIVGKFTPAEFRNQFLHVSTPKQALDQLADLCVQID